MERQRWSLIQALFDKYVDTPPADRRAALEAECPDDRPLMEEVLAMCLAADRTTDRQTPDVAALIVDLFADLEDPYLGRILGPYHLDVLLGHGGMGRVYKATRQDYGGVVAVKVLYERVPVEPILQSRTITAELKDTIALARRERFLLEEKTLAKLAHPAIARLMDAGAEPDGTLYFVMEYVEGKTLLQHCQENALGLRQRLGLFRLVCDAVQHAHQQSVIHRDLKPSNILVTAAGQVKLLDFGISESLHVPNLEPRAHSSGYMTLAYASPEQVQRAPSAVQADVYALGVILQELISNRLPFDFKGKDTEQIRRMILEVRPTPPSTSASRQLASRSQWQDLDAICAKALSKDPGGRYGSAEAFAADVDRFLGLKPLLCRQPLAASYRLGKYVRRNKSYLLLAGSAVALLLALVFFYTYRLRIARDQALSDAQRAKDVQQFVVNLFKGFDPEMERVSRESAEAVLNRGEREALSLKSQPLVQADVFDTLGSAFENLGSFDRAASLYQGALAIRERLFGKDSPNTVEDLTKLGDVGDDLSQFEKAEKIDREAVRLAKLERPNDPIRVAKAEVGLGNILVDVGKNQEALQLFQDALQLSMLGKTNLDVKEDCEIGLSMAENNLGNLPMARFYNREALRISRRLRGENNPDVAANLMTANEFDTLAGNYAQAERDGREAWQISESWLGPKNPRTIEAQRILAQDLTSLGQYAEAETLLRQALSFDEQASPEPHKESGLLWSALGNAQQQRDEWHAAEISYFHALTVYRSIYPGKDYKIGVALDNLGTLYYRSKQLKKAEQESREALAMLHRTLPPEHTRVAFAEGHLGQILAAEHQYREAELMLLTSYETLKHQKPAPVVSMNRLRDGLQKLYLRAGEPEKARQFAEPVKQ